MPVRIAGAFDLFPTFDPRQGKGLLLADGKRLSFLINAEGTRSGIVAPNEVWIDPGDAAGLASLRATIAAGGFGDPTSSTLKHCATPKTRTPSPPPAGTACFSCRSPRCSY